MEMPETVTVIGWAEGHTYHGLEVRMTMDITLEEALAVGSLTVGNEQAAFDQIGQYLRGWNLTRKGAAIPCTAAELRKRPLPFIVALVVAYRRALEEVMTVDDPFVVQSNNGAT